MVAVPQINDLVAYQQLIKEKKKVQYEQFCIFKPPYEGNIKNECSLTLFKL